MTLEEIEEVYVPNIVRYNNLLHILQIYYRKRDKFTSLQPIFRTVQSPVLVTLLQRILEIDGAEFWKSKRCLSQEHIYLK